jgi:hypothetical protein
MQMTKHKLPTTTTAANADRALALPSSSVTLSEAISLFSTELQQAIGGMNADDISLEYNVSRGELNLRLRAYRHRRENGGGLRS